MASWEQLKELAFNYIEHFRLGPFLGGFLLSCGFIVYMINRSDRRK